jgi:hypothetical protein
MLILNALNSFNRGSVIDDLWKFTSHLNNQDTISPRQLATAIGVSESSIKRWCDQGSLSVIRTAGGHRRIPINAAIDYIRKSGRSIIRPELLRLPTIRKRLPSLSAYNDPLMEHLINGMEAASRQIAYELCVSHHSLPAVFDEVIVPVLQRLSFESAAGRIEEYQAERAKTFLSSIIAEVRATVFVRSEANVVCGATTLGDHDFCSNQLAELSLRHIGMSASSLGTSLTPNAMCRAVEQLQPKLFWISVSEVNSDNKLMMTCEAVSKTLNTYHGKLLLCGPEASRFTQPVNAFGATTVCSSFADFVRTAKSFS